MQKARLGEAGPEKGKGRSRRPLLMIVSSRLLW